MFPPLGRFGSSMPVGTTKEVVLTVVSSLITVLPQPAPVARPGDMRFVQRDGEMCKTAAGAAEGTRMHSAGQPVCDLPGQRLGGGVPSGEGGFVVQVAVAEVGDHGLELFGGPADVDDDAVGVERLPLERGVDHVG